MKKRTQFVPNIISILISFIAIAVFIVSIIQLNNVRRFVLEQKAEIDKIYLSIRNDTIYSDNTSDEKFIEYAKEIDQKSADAINIVIAFVGCIFSVTTIINTIIALRMPNAYEVRLKEIDSMLVEVKNYAMDAKIYAKIVEANSSSTNREKIEDLSNIISNDEYNSSQAYFSRGFLYDEIKEYAKAETDYRMALKLGGEKNTYYNSMGVLYNNMFSNSKEEDKRRIYLFKTAEKYYLRAIEILEKKGQNSSYCYCNLACLYQDYAKYKGECENLKESQQYSDKAINLFGKALKLDDNNATAHMNRGISFEEMGKEHYEDAYKDYLSCIEIDPENDQARIYRAELGLKLFTQTNNIKYLSEAKKDVTSLRKQSNRIDRLLEQISASENKLKIVQPVDVDSLLRKIDEKIADLCVEEAKTHNVSSNEYSDNISEAKKLYSDLINNYKEQYETTKNPDALSSLQRIQEKLNKIDSNPQ